MLLPADRIERISGWGGAVDAVGYLWRPTSSDEIASLYRLADSAGRKIALRGGGRSYGDGSLGSEEIVIDLSRMNRITSWDPKEGILTCEPGATIEQITKYCLGDGWWMPVVPGTMHTTIGGSLGMNIHGKNNFREGTLGEHVLAFDLMTPSGEVRHITPDSNSGLFFAAISSFGMLGCFTSITLKMKKIHSGSLDVRVYNAKDLGTLFSIYDDQIPESDYLVGWIDAFAKGDSLGRAVVHRANYLKEGEDTNPAQSLRNEAQMLPDTIMGIIPKSIVWKLMRFAMNDLGMKFINSAKFFSSNLPIAAKQYRQSLTAFSFLLDFVPNWKLSYGRGGLIQYQSFIPKEHAEDVFRKQIMLSQQAGLVPYLAVFKRHRTDPFLISHGVDGYSLALDYKVTLKTQDALWKLCHQMNDLVLASGGRFYFAKDLTLRPQDTSYLGDAIRTLYALKKVYDPNGILQTDLSKRLFSF